MKINKEIFLQLFVIAMIPLLLSGCDGLFNDGKVYYNTDDPKVELFPLTASFTLAADSTVAYDLRAQLIGEQRNEALNLGIAVVDSLTTAQEGVQFTLSQNSITIPADSSSAVVPITVNGAGLTAGETVTFAIRLQGTEEVEAATNLDTHIVTIQGGNDS